MSDVLEKIKTIQNKLDILDDKIELVLSLLKQQTASCNKMDSHITFIENTYDTLRTPLNFITSNVNKMMGITSTQPLPILNTDTDTDI